MQIEIENTNKELDMGRVITIDGPAASGKTSVSRELAKRLHWKWVSTGAFYRGLAFAALQTNTDLADELQLSHLASSDVWNVVMSDDQTKVVFNDSDVTDLILQEDVGSAASKVSQFPLVRASLLKVQRQCAEGNHGLVAEGRDCGTVVFPNAKIKIYLTARQEDRAQRRAKELGLSASETKQAQQIRDQQDLTRKTAPLQIPENALVVDTTSLNFEQVVEHIHEFISKKMK